MTNFLRPGLLGLVLAATAGPARADLQATFTSESPGAGVSLTGSYSPTTGTSFAYTNGSAGRMNFQVTGGSDAAKFGGPGASIAAFCVDLVGYVLPAGSYSVSAVTPAAPGIPELTGTAAQKATEVGQLKELLGSHFKDAATDGTKAAALQTAIWAVVYDSGTPDLTNPTKNLQVMPSAATTLAESYLQALGTNPNSFNQTFGSGAQLVVLAAAGGSTHGQDQITVIPGPPTTVPAPAGLVLGLVAAAGLGVRRRLAGPAVA